MTRVLVLGASGMAGHVIAGYLIDKGYSVQTLSAHHKFNNDTVVLDVTNMRDLETFLKSHTYDIVVNCIGVLVKASEEHKDVATYLNSYLPHFLEQLYSSSGTRIIHLSTDCVFSGNNAPYKEDSPYDGQLFYDRSKALGEIINNKDLTFRMSIIGPDRQPEGIGLFNWFYAQTGEVKGYTKAVWNGITTTELARAIDAAIKTNLTGLYHLVPKTNITKYELLNLFAQTFGRNDITIASYDQAMVLDKTLINTRSDFNFRVKSYEEMLMDMKSWIDIHSSDYPHYAKK